jgi:methylenetetrahydrofolate reductase (NADPH)
MTLARLLTTPKYEVIPMKNVEATFAFIPRDAKVSVTVSPSKGIKATLELTQNLTKYVSPAHITPHLSARLLESEAQLKDILGRVHTLGVQELFIVGGDTFPPKGPFANSLELVQAIRAIDTTIRLGVTAYPEGHPRISKQALLEDLRLKQPYVQFMSTQLCFDAATIKNWLEQTRKDGITLPVQIGIAGVVDIIKLAQISSRIGVGDSLRYLTKHAGQVFKLMTGYQPDDLVHGLEPLYADPFFNIAGFHVYTFNQLEKTERWRQQTLALLELAPASA